MTKTPQDIALYIHWPFCQSKCPYCDFNSHIRPNIQNNLWHEALVTELKTTIRELGPRQLKSIFFGGGTPSLMPPEIVSDLIETAQNAWNKNQNETIEITLEANPTSVDIGRFKAYKEAGVNRLSIGVQSFNEDRLKFLGRLHNSQQAQYAIETAASLFDRYSFDLIYAQPHQSLSDWKQELQQALHLAGGHLSLYQLTIEPGTAFHTQYRLGAFQLPNEEEAAQLYEETQAIMEKASMPAYEISNHALLGHESQHNLVYWRYQDYAGIGPGAHGRVTKDGQKYAVIKQRLPEKWLESVTQHQHATQEENAVSLYEQFQETMLMGLRLRDGIDLQIIHNVEKFLNEDRMLTLIDEGFLSHKNDKLYATKEGQQRLNAVLDYLLNSEYT